MRKIVATVMLAATAAVFTPAAVPQVPHNAMALNASAPQEIKMVPRLQGPEPAFAWVFALGFLGLVMTRRIRASSQF
jgi:hypothetical protein